MLSNAYKIFFYTCNTSTKCWSSFFITKNGIVVFIPYCCSQIKDIIGMDLINAVKWIQRISISFIIDKKSTLEISDPRDKEFIDMYKKALKEYLEQSKDKKFRHFVYR